MTRLTSINMDIERRGQGIPAEQRTVVERLRKQAFSMQNQFQLAEHTAVILAQMLRDDDGNVAAALDNTYEAHVFTRLQLQLFRLLIVDLYACVLDGNPRTGSVRSILKELRREPAALDALIAYYSDASSLTVTIEDSAKLDPELIQRLKAREIQRSTEDNIRSMRRLWEKVDKDSSILCTDEARRMSWARVKAVAHLEKTDDGLVLLDHEPPFGNGKLTFYEPILFLKEVAPYVYDVLNLVTANSWSDAEPIDRFYAQCFWDRLKNGHTDLKPPNSY